MLKALDKRSCSNLLRVPLETLSPSLTAERMQPARSYYAPGGKSVLPGKLTAHLFCLCQQKSTIMLMRANSFFCDSWSYYLTLAGKVTNLLSSSICLKWLSEAKLKARSEASRQNISNFNFCREASLRAFSFASLSHYLA